jgi:MYXO-CTERM domain-containing protein
MRRPAVELALFLTLSVAASLVAPNSSAAPVRFGYSGVHALPAKVWCTLEEPSRLLFLAERLERAAALGASVLRLGATEPRLIDYATIHASKFRNWLFADKVVGLLSAAQLEVCLTLPELFDTPEIGGFQSYVKALTERYDGDEQFGVEPVALNAEFPDLNGSGEITADEFQAKPGDARVTAWASAHRVTLVEPGHEPYGAEQTAQLTKGAYSAQVKAARTAAKDAGGTQRIMLGGTAVESQSKSNFTERLKELMTGGPWFDVANAHVFASTDDLTGISAAANVSKFGNWLDSVGHGDAERWVGELAFGTVAKSGSACVDARCSLRTQATGLARQMVLAAADGVSTILYTEPIELIGSQAAAGPRTGTGLLTLSLESGANPFGLKDHPLPLVPRPAYAVWRRLAAVLGAEDAAVTSLAGMPENVRGFRVGSKGYVLWYDWTLQAQPGEAWSGQRVPVELGGLTSPSVKVVSLWPESVPAQLEADGSVAAAWTESLVGVSGGTASLLLEEDPVWVEASDAVVQPPVADESPGDVAGGDTAEADESGSGGGSGGGCSGGGDAGEWPAPLLGLLALATLTSRRRSPAR